MKIRFKKPKIKLNKKSILISTCIFSFLILFILPMNFRAGLDDIMGGAIAYILRLFGKCLDSLITDNLKMGINKLIFNIKDGDMSKPTILTDYNLTLLRGNSLSTTLFQLYDLFVYIAGSLLGVVALFTVFDFIKTASDIKHKAVLKRRLTTLLISIILLLSIPRFFDILMVINQTIVDIFRLFIVEIMKGGGDTQGTFLTSVFKKLAEDSPKDPILAAIYMMSGFLNAWLVVFYMIRDLAIAYLFMLGPVIVILLPYRIDLVKQWFRELCSNIFTQAIQAMVLAVIIAICKGLGNDSSYYDKIFGLVAFASFIPTTAWIKKVFGLEGEIGAAKSNAGLGAVAGALALTAAASVALKNKASGIKDNIGDMRNIRNEEKLLKKSNFQEGSGLSTQVGGNSRTANRVGGGRGAGIDPDNRTATNKNHNVDTKGHYDGQGGYSATSRARQLAGMKSNAKKSILKGIVGGGLGAVAGGAMALGSSVYGNQRATMMGAMSGASIGNSVGEQAGGLMHNGASAAAEGVKDKAFGEGIRYDGESFQALDSVFEGTKMPSSPMDFNTVKENMGIIKGNFNKNRETIKTNKANAAELQPTVTGLDPSSMSSQNYAKETKAILKRNSLERRGKFSSAHRNYARNTYNRNNEVEKVNPIIEDNKDRYIDNSDYNPPMNEKPINENVGKLDIQMQEYMNNDDYLSALKSCQFDSPSLFMGDDNGQLC